MYSLRKCADGWEAERGEGMRDMGRRERVMAKYIAIQCTYIPLCLSQYSTRLSGDGTYSSHHVSCLSFVESCRVSYLMGSERDTLITSWHSAPPKYGLDCSRDRDPRDVGHISTSPHVRHM